jgi:phytoene dehydrogenase-like protein
VERHEADLTIIGAGPAGLYGAYYAGFRGLKVAVLDSLPEPGGQVAALYPEKLIFDVAGFPAVKGQDLIERCVEQAAPYDPTYLLGHRAETLEKQEDGSFVIGTHKGVRRWRPSRWSSPVASARSRPGRCPTRGLRGQGPRLLRARARGDARQGRAHRRRR